MTYWGAWLIGPAFLGLAVWFVWGQDLADIPDTRPPAGVARPISSAPIRNPVGDPPIIEIDGFTRTCMECHRLFPSRPEAARQLVQHRHIVMDHGLNDLCFNCHDRQDRNRLSLRGNRTVSFAEAPRLCAKCHGPTYRDWQRGMHGRTNGYWNASAGTPTRLTCVQCHDPHAPAFDDFAPLPGPHTLRMGQPSPHGYDSAVEHIDPLRKWEYGQPKAHTPVELEPVPLSPPMPGDEESH